MGSDDHVIKEDEDRENLVSKLEASFDEIDESQFYRKHLYCKRKKFRGMQKRIDISRNELLSAMTLVNSTLLASST